MALQDYKTHMKGVDLCDQMIGYYHIRHRSNKWWQRLYFHWQMAAVLTTRTLSQRTVILAMQQPSGRPSSTSSKTYLHSAALVGDVRASRDAPLPPARQRAITRCSPCACTAACRRPAHHCEAEPSKTCRECELQAGEHHRRGVTKYRCRQCNEPVHQTGDCVAHRTQHHLLA